MKANILVIDDEEGIRISFESFLSNEGHQVLTAEDYKALVDEKERIESEKERYRRNLDLIFRSVKDAIIMVDKDLHVIEANKATQHICGVAPPEMIGKAFSEVITRLYNLERELKERHRFHHIIGKSKKMQEIYRLLENLVGTETTVLITGESGTGKELVAKALHHEGTRAGNAMVTINCSALTENLLESELFGHVKGAFTGAVKDKAGRFQMADGGTIFLDEIGEVSPRLQLKLLRFLQEKEFEKVGDYKTRKVDVQVITATNRDLQAKIKQGEFREDLYYRLKVVEVALPPLRERREDIPLLFNHFKTLFNTKPKKY